MFRFAFPVSGAIILLLAACSQREDQPNAEQVTSPAQDSAASSDEPWDIYQWNPNAMEGDFILPAPCGANIVFRAVDTPTHAGALDDYSFRMGSSDEVYAYAEYHRPGYVAGSVAGDKRRYYVGKYEISRDQYDAVMGECPGRPLEGGAAMEGVSWFDAVQFTRNYNEWLLENAPSALDATGLEDAFIRLPTEAEWEFAARGGAAVSKEERRAPVFPMDGEIGDYVWFSGFDSCGGDIQKIGELLPNPLGFHDILGNVAEYVLEPFHLNRAGRIHGESGAASARGGSCLTGYTDVRTAARFETLLFQNGKLAEPTFVGFRLAIAAPIVSSQLRLSEIKEDWTSIRRMRTITGPGDDPIAALQEVAEATDDAALRDAALRAAGSFVEEMRRRNEIEKQSVETALRAGGLAVRDYLTDKLLLSRAQGVLEMDGPGDVRAVANRKRALDRMAVTRDIYANILFYAAENFEEAALRDASQDTIDDLELRMERMNISPVITKRLFATFADQAVQYQQNQEDELDVYFTQLDDLYAEIIAESAGPD